MEHLGKSDDSPAPQRDVLHPGPPGSHQEADAPAKQPGGGVSLGDRAHSLNLGTFWSLRLCRSPAGEVPVRSVGPATFRHLQPGGPSSFPAATAVTTVSAWGPVSNLFLQRCSASPLNGLQPPGCVSQAGLANRQRALLCCVGTRCLLGLRQMLPQALQVGKGSWDSGRQRKPLAPLEGPERLWSSSRSADATSISHQAVRCTPATRAKGWSPLMDGRWAP